MDKTMPNYKGMYEKQEEQIAHLKCVCEGQEKKLLYYERKVNKLKKKNKKLKKQLNEVESNYSKFIILLSEVTNERYCTRNIINEYETQVMKENKGLFK